MIFESSKKLLEAIDCELAYIKEDCNGDLLNALSNERRIKELEDLCNQVNQLKEEIDKKMYNANYYVRSFKCLKEYQKKYNK